MKMKLKIYLQRGNIDVVVEIKDKFEEDLINGEGKGIKVTF